MTTWEQEAKLLAKYEARQANLNGDVMYWNRKPQAVDEALIDKAAAKIKAGPYPPILPDPRLSAITADFYAKEESEMKVLKSQSQASGVPVFTAQQKAPEPWNRPGTVQERFQRMCDAIQYEASFARCHGTATAMGDFLLKWFAPTVAPTAEQQKGVWNEERAAGAMDAIGWSQGAVAAHRTQDDDDSSPFDIQLQSVPVQTNTKKMTDAQHDAHIKRMDEALNKLQKSLNKTQSMPMSGSGANLSFGSAPMILGKNIPTFTWPESKTDPEAKAEAKCDCGGAKAKTTHSDWCSVSDKSVLASLFTDKR